MGAGHVFAKGSAVTAATEMDGKHTHHMTADHMTGGGSGLAPVDDGPSTTGAIPVYTVYYTGVVPALMVPVHWCTLLVQCQCYWSSEIPVYTAYDTGVVPVLVSVHSV